MRQDKDGSRETPWTLSWPQRELMILTMGMYSLLSWGLTSLPIYCLILLTIDTILVLLYFCVWYFTHTVDLSSAMSGCVRARLGPLVVNMTPFSFNAHLPSITVILRGELYTAQSKTFCLSHASSSICLHLMLSCTVCRLSLPASAYLSFTLEVKQEERGVPHSVIIGDELVKKITKTS